MINIRQSYIYTKIFKSWLLKDIAFRDKAALINRVRPVIFDVGANVGQSTDKYLYYFPQSIIHAFEPIPSVYELFQSRYRKFTNIFCNNQALSMQNGQNSFYVNQCNYTSSLYKPTQVDKRLSHENDFQLDFKEKITVNTTTLDQYCQQLSINHIDILKLDTQGSELDVIKGSSGMLSNYSIDVIFSEVEFIPLYQNQALFEDLLKWLKSKGYYLSNLYNLHQNSAGQLEAADALFISKKFAKVKYKL